MKSKTESGSGWYPGKFIKERRASKTAKACGPESSVSNSSHGPSLGSILEGDPSQGATAGRGPTRRGYGPERSVGQVSVKILETRFVTATKPVLEVSFDNQAETHPFLCDQFEPKEILFSVGNITSDINILLVEEYSVGGSRDIQGALVLPLTRYMGVTAPAPPKVEWFQFFSYAEVLSVAGDGGEGGAESHPGPAALTLRSGDAAFPGSAMNKRKQSVGFVCVQVEVFLSEPAYKLYLKSFHPDSAWAAEREPSVSDLALPSSPSGDGGDGGAVLLVPFDPEAAYSLLRRMQRLAALPAVVAPMLTFPEVIVIIILYGFVCFGTEIWHLPLIFFVVVLTNGCLTALDDRYGHVMIWNRSESAKAARQKIKVDDLAKFKTLQPFFGAAQQRLEKLVVFLEKFSNMWYWSDARVSFVAYAGLFAACLFVSILSRTIGIRFVLFFCGSAVLLYLSLSAVVMRNLAQFRRDSGVASTESGEDSTEGPAPSRVRELRTNVALSILDGLEMFSNFYARIPDSVVLEHRFIAGSAFVFENAQEMQDAAESFKKND